MNLKFYEDWKSPIVGTSVFLAGVTTDAKPDGIGHYRGTPMSLWRAEFLNQMEAFGSQNLEVMIPEFRNKTLPFRDQAEALWGRTRVPVSLRGKVRAQSTGTLVSEETKMAQVDRVVLWLDLRPVQPGLGLNLRSEAEGLICRAGMARRLRLTQPPKGVWVPRSLLVGISDTCQNSTRFKLNLKEFGIPWVSSLEELASMVVRPPRASRILP